MSVAEQMLNVACDAKAASQTLARLTSEVKNELLLNMAQALLNNSDLLATENEKDLSAAREAVIAGSAVIRINSSEICK